MVSFDTSEAFPVAEYGVEKACFSPLASERLSNARGLGYLLLSCFLFSECPAQSLAPLGVLQGKRVQESEEEFLETGEVGV